MSILFENQKTIIQFRKEESPKRILVISFEYGSEPGLLEDRDTVLQREGYAEAFILKQEYACITVKRRQVNFYQDLSLEDFRNAVQPVVGEYEKVFTYGSSGGAYAALYFGSCIGARPICFAPRLSIHPVFGASGKNAQFDIAITHQKLQDLGASDVEPLVIYDPCDPMDRAYVVHEILPAFPKVQLIEMPRFGHSVIQVLSELRVLKPLILNYVEKGEVSTARSLGSNRSQSIQYLKSLIDFATRRKKHKSAEMLLLKAESLLQPRLTSDNEKLVKQTRVDIAGFNLQTAKAFHSTGRLAEERGALLKALTYAPSNPKVLSALTSYYLRSTEYGAAALCSSTLVRLRPNHCGYRVLLAQSLLRAGNKEEAAAQADHIVKNMKPDLGGWRTLASLYGELGMADAEGISRKKARALQKQRDEAKSKAK